MINSCVWCLQKRALKPNPRTQQDTVFIWQIIKNVPLRYDVFKNIAPYGMLIDYNESENHKIVWQFKTPISKGAKCISIPSMRWQ